MGAGDGSGDGEPDAGSGRVAVRVGAEESFEDVLEVSQKKFG